MLITLFARARWYASHPLRTWCTGCVFFATKFPLSEDAAGDRQHARRGKKEPAGRLCAGPAGHFTFALSTNATSERAYAN
jgi:hypothetical protein